jgi:hypothetical protein
VRSPLFNTSSVLTIRTRSGSVCLDVINQTWSPMFGQSSINSLSIFGDGLLDMINIFEVFLPQLLRYPNPNDPLNGEAAALLMRHPKEYEAKVKGPTLTCLSAPDHELIFSSRIRSTICNEGGSRRSHRRERQRRRRPGDERYRQHKRG